MKLIFVPVAVALTILQFTTVAEAGSCYFDGSDGFRLPDYLDANGTIACAPGFICPNFDPANATTYPVSCPPDPACQLERSQGMDCKQQGDFEPFLCRSGHYCPRGKNVMLKCPSGKQCNFGTDEPKDCPALAFCPGDAKIFNYTPLVVFLLVSVAFVAGVLVYRRKLLNVNLPAASPAPSPVNKNSPVEDEIEMGVSQKEVHDQELIEGFHRSRKNMQPLRFEFNKLAVSVTDKATGNKKQLLQEMSGTMEPGTVTAILGPSGAGKTTFMNSLLGKNDPAWSTSGKLLVNGSKALSKITHSIGFVPQDDILHEELSVYKNVYYSSETRLPHDWTSEQRATFRTAVLGALNLTDAANVTIAEGASRKRTSIGVELAAAPLAMFLDEPTSGLDATTSLDVCASLKRIAEETQLTVGMVVHQPRVEIWNALDQVLFIGVGGRVVYQGDQAGAQQFFTEKCGVKFPSTANPADVIIDAITERSDELADLWRDHVEGPSPTIGLSTNQVQFEDEGKEILNVDGLGFRGAGFFKQLFLTHNRTIEKQLATLSSLRLELMISILFGLVLGTSYLEFEFTGSWKYYRRISPIAQTAYAPQMFMYTCMSTGLYAAPAGVRVFSNDRLNFFRGAAAGYNSLAYFVGTLIAVIYRVLFVTLLYAGVYSFSGGLTLPFMWFFLSLLMIMWCSYCVAFITSMLVNKTIAPLVAQIATLCIAVMNGFVAYPTFMKQMSYSFQASQILANLWYKTTDHVFQEQLTEWDYAVDTEGQSAGICFAISVILLTIAYVLMIVMDRDRQR